MTPDRSSPLRYPGGKSFLTGFLVDTIRLNHLEGGTYVEPFAGGAGAALNLLLGEYVSAVYLNDLDPCIFSFWKSILDDTEKFLRLVMLIPLDVATWRTQREIVRKPKCHSRLELGFAAFYLNRTNRSGVFNAGPIGAIEQTGNYSIGVRFNRKELCRRIERIALYRERIVVSKMDAVEFLATHLVGTAWHKSNTIVYLDPPYCDKGQRLYSRFFRDEDHSRLAKFLNGCAAFRWLISYDDASLIHRLYAGEKNVLFMNYFMHTVRVGRELIIGSSDCELPQHFFERTETVSNPVSKAHG